MLGWCRCHSKGVGWDSFVELILSVYLTMGSRAGMRSLAGHAVSPLSPLAVPFQCHQAPQERAESHWPEGLLPAFLQLPTHAKASLLLSAFGSLAARGYNCPLSQPPASMGPKLCRLGSRWPGSLPTWPSSAFHPVSARGRFPE